METRPLKERNFKGLWDRVYDRFSEEILSHLELGQ